MEYGTLEQMLVEYAEALLCGDTNNANFHRRVIAERVEKVPRSVSNAVRVLWRDCTITLHATPGGMMTIGAVLPDGCNVGLGMYILALRTNTLEQYRGEVRGTILSKLARTDTMPTEIIQDDPPAWRTMPTKPPSPEWLELALKHPEYRRGERPSIEPEWEV